MWWIVKLVFWVAVGFVLAATTCAFSFFALTQGVRFVVDTTNTFHLALALYAAVLLSVIASGLVALLVGRHIWYSLILPVLGQDDTLVQDLDKELSLFTYEQRKK